MGWSLISNIPEFTLAIVSGFVYGFLIRKGHLSRSDTFIKQLLLRDFTVFKVLVSAVITGFIGLYLMGLLGSKPTNLSGSPIIMSILGGSLFGIGIAVGGYTPGTMIAALGEGAKDAAFGLVGMIVGAFIFNGIYPNIKDMTMPDALHRQTLTTVFSLSEGILAVILISGLIYYFYKKNKKGG